MKKIRATLGRLIQKTCKELPSDGYKTIIYLKIGQPIVIHDSLYYGQVASEEQLSELTEFWKIDEIAFDEADIASTD